MKVTFAPHISELTGRENLKVYSKNRSGNYIKGFTKPSNPNTSAQSNARSVFTLSSNAWFGLSLAVRTLFNSYANTEFKALNRDSRTKAYNGRSAFNSLYNVCSFSNTFLANTLMSMKGSDKTNPYSLVDTDLTIPVTAPAAMAFSGLLHYNYAAVSKTDPIVWTPTLSSTVTPAAEVCNVVFSGLTSTAIVAGDLVKMGLGALGNGFRLYISEVKAVEGAAVSNPFSRCILATGKDVQFTDTAGVAANTSLKIGCIVGATPWLALSAGWYYCTLIAVDASGQQSVVGSKWAQCT